jgi:hypothetical protein
MSSEKAGVGGLTPSLATIFSIAWRIFLNSYVVRKCMLFRLRKAQVRRGTILESIAYRLLNQQNADFAGLRSKVFLRSRMPRSCQMDRIRGTRIRTHVARQGDRGLRTAWYLKEPAGAKPKPLVEKRSGALRARRATNVHQRCRSRLQLGPAKVEASARRVGLESLQVLPFVTQRRSPPRHHQSIFQAAVETCGVLSLELGLSAPKILTLFPTWSKARWSPRRLLAIQHLNLKRLVSEYACYLPRGARISGWGEGNCQLGHVPWRPVRSFLKSDWEACATGTD